MARCGECFASESACCCPRPTQVVELGQDAWGVMHYSDGTKRLPYGIAGAYGLLVFGGIALTVLVIAWLVR
jgi:hypothetical protein